MTSRATRRRGVARRIAGPARTALRPADDRDLADAAKRSEEHTSELQSLRHLVCRLLLEKKKKKKEKSTRPSSDSLVIRGDIGWERKQSGQGSAHTEREGVKNEQGLPERLVPSKARP